MNQEWRYTTKSVTKYNPVFRDEKGHYKRDEWVGFFQIGKRVNGELLAFSLYEEIENKYITAAKWFFQFHNCACVSIKNLEKKNITDYEYSDKDLMLENYNLINEGELLSVQDLEVVVKLVLRDLIWAELFCDQNESVAIRFGYDFYMYFNSPKNLDLLEKQIAKLGLFVW